MKSKTSVRLLPTALVAFCNCSLTASAVAASTAATEADRFVASTAVATHWRFNNVYLNYAGLSDKLIDSGIRYSRDTGTGRDFVAKIQKLSDAGVKSIVTLNPASGTRPNSGYWANSPALALNDHVRAVGRDVIAFAEMNNELDMPSQQGATYWRSLSEPLSADPASPYYFVDYAQAATADTWNQLADDDDPAIAGLPLIGPSFFGDAAYSATGDLSAHIEYSNVHHYLYGWNPEVANIRGIDHAVTNQSQVQGPGRGFAATEGGGSTAASLSGTWPLFAHGRYIPRYFLAHFVKGFALTTAYELVDEGTSPANQEHNFGLLKNDLSEKPAFTALKNILSVLKDPGPSFSAGSLDYSLSGSTANVWSVLFRKRNGDYYLCLWLGLPCYNPVTATTLTVSAQSVALDVPASVASAQVFTVDDAGAMTSSAEAIVSGSIALSVTDRVTIVRLSSSSIGGAASSPGGVRAIPASGQVTLKWAPVFEAATYSVKRAASSGGTYSVIASGLTNPIYTDLGLTNGTPGYYAVTATNAGGESLPSSPLCVVPAAPVIIDNADVTGVTITGAWTASTSTAGYYGTNFIHDANAGATGGKSVRFTPTLPVAGDYDVYLRWPAASNRATNTPTEIVHAGGTHSVAINQQLTSNTWVLLGTFNFSAGTSGSLAVKNDGANGYVIADAVRFELTRPRPPAGLTATTGSTPVSLAWTARPGAVSYTVKRALSPSGPFVVIASGLTTPSHDDTTAIVNTVYYYVVSTVNAGGESVDSAPVAGATGLEVVTDNADSTGVTITGAWTASSYAPGYYGANYLHDSNTGATGGKAVTFAPAIPLAGRYHVYLRWTSEANRADNVPVDIVHLTGIATTSVNQKTCGGIWTLLGTYDFAAGPAVVTVRNDGANGYVVADAAKLVLD